jgi:hypothetical protein
MSPGTIANPITIIPYPSRQTLDAVASHAHLAALRHAVIQATVHERRGRCVLHQRESRLTLRLQFGRVTSLCTDAQPITTDNAAVIGLIEVVSVLAFRADKRGLFSLVIYDACQTLLDLVLARGAYRSLHIEQVAILAAKAY